MAIILLGQTTVFWSGVVTGVFFVLNYATCYSMPWAKTCKINSSKLICQLHNPFAWLTLIIGIVHITLAILAYIFGIWI